MDCSSKAYLVSPLSPWPIPVIVMLVYACRIMFQLSRGFDLLQTVIFNHALIISGLLNWIKPRTFQWESYHLYP